jgi:hypothetical protein
LFYRKKTGFRLKNLPIYLGFVEFKNCNVMRERKVDTARKPVNISAATQI